MPIVTNIHRLPTPIVRAVENDPYSRGDADISVTSLIGPPRIHFLKERFGEEIVVDVSDCIWSLLGQGIHAILERGAADTGHIAERRLYAKIDGVTISGGMDLTEATASGNEICDYKMSSARAFAFPKKEWAQQLNSYAWIYNENYPRKPVKALSVCLISRDFDRNRVGSDGYPDAPIVRIPIKLWRKETQLAFIRERLALYKEARQKDFFDEDLPECTDEDRWKKEDKFACTKIGNKRPTKIFGTMLEAEQFIATTESKAGWEIEHRPGISLRCAEWCEVSAHCSQWAKERALHEEAESAEPSGESPSQPTFETEDS